MVEPLVSARNLAANRSGPRVVGVIMSGADLDFAIRMRKPPDFFELRLDRLVRIVDELENKLPNLRAPLIITARHPQEGGANKLSIRQRRNLLSRFLRRASYVDVELRSASALRSVLRLAERKKVRRIISFHNFKSTPQLRVLRAKARAAKTQGANIFKVATRTDTAAQLARLLDFMSKQKTVLSGAKRSRMDVNLPISAMGIGKLGAISRVLLARCGSALVYAHLGKARIAGQLDLPSLRKSI